MIKRNLYRYLQNWKENARRKPLIIRGARQVGKTTLVKQFGEEYDHFLSFNLDKLGDLAMFESVDSIDELVQLLFISKRVTNRKGITLIFIDEIQESPKTMQLLRYFYEDYPELHVIAAGSLLEHTLTEVKSFPVGRVSYAVLNPLNFEEYLGALGEDSLLEEFNCVPYNSIVKKLLFDHFHNYCMLGGLPEVVAAYAKHEDIRDALGIYDELLFSYKEDMGKYAPTKKQAEVVSQVFDSVPKEADSRITFVRFGGSNYDSASVKTALLDLEKARIVQLIYPTNSVSVPITPNRRVKPRLQFIDTGLMNYALGIQGLILQLDDLANSYKGKIIQHLVTQELNSIQISPSYKTAFWVREKKTSNAEIDLIWKYEQYLIPVEVKSGKTGRLRSLMEFMDRCDHVYAVRLYKGPLQIDEISTIKGKAFRLLNLPYFLGAKIPEYIEWFVGQ